MIYLNNAATSWPKAKGLAGYMSRVIDGIPVHGSRATGNGETVESRNARQELAQLMEISDCTRISYMENGTHGLNTALLGYTWEEGDVILTSAAEHNSVLRPLWWLKKNRGVEYVILPVQEDGRIKMECLSEALQQYHPKMVVITHASNVTGAVNPLEEITALAHKAGAVVLADACQSLGIIPVLPQQWGVDMLAFTGHKYLLGPQGTGGIYVREGIMLDPVMTGGTGIFSDEEEMPAQSGSRHTERTGISGAWLVGKLAEESSDESPKMDGVVRGTGGCAAGTWRAYHTGEGHAHTCAVVYGPRLYTGGNW